jgi:hypothetical protein
LCKQRLHNCLVRPRGGERAHVLQVARREALHLGEHGVEVDAEPVDVRRRAERKVARRPSARYRRRAIRSTAPPRAWRPSITTGAKGSTMKNMPETVCSRWLTDKLEGFCKTVAEDQELPLDLVRGIAIGAASELGEDRGPGDAWVEYAVLTRLGPHVVFAFSKPNKNDVFSTSKAEQEQTSRLEQMGQELAGPDPLKEQRRRIALGLVPEE